MWVCGYVCSALTLFIIGISGASSSSSNDSVASFISSEIFADSRSTFHCRRVCLNETSMQQREYGLNVHDGTFSCMPKISVGGK